MELGDTLVVGVVVGLVFAGVAWLVMQWRDERAHRRRRAETKPYDPLEDQISQWRLPSDAAVSSALKGTPEAPTERREMDQTPGTRFYVERVIGAGYFGWIALVANNVICFVMAMNEKTILPQIFDVLIMLNGNIIILMLMLISRRSAFVAGHGQPPEGR